MFLKLLVKRPAHAGAFPGVIFRNYVRLAGSDQWVSKEVTDMFPMEDGTRITLEHMCGEGINASLEELAILAVITKSVRPKSIFEIGTFRGRTALNFALNAPAECTIYTLDLPLDKRAARSHATNPSDQRIIGKSQTGVDYYGKDVAGKIQQLYGDSRTFDFSEYFGRIDLVLVDGAHDYETALADSANALRMITSDGVIVWHDFANYGDYNGVTRAVLATVPADEVVQLGSTQLAAYMRTAAV